LERRQREEEALASEREGRGSQVLEVTL